MIENQAGDVTNDQATQIMANLVENRQKFRPPLTQGLKPIPALISSVGVFNERWPGKI